ncbi:MAG: SIMPL domain-containing protein [Ottowia sp.]|uniref:SIMPL domain-containing protein n=1 Tax=Ottowia sp. TaxID=1898956 RepID=UPI0039E2597F
MKPRLALTACLAAAACGAAVAQPAAIAPPRNVLQLSASGQVEVRQDLLTLTLAATREGADAAGVQAELREAVDAALAEARKTAQPQQMDVRSGGFGVHPRYGRDGKIGGWQGRVEVVLEGRDFPRITQAAARASSMTIGSLAFGLSREQRARVEGEAQAQAIERFKAKAAEIAKAFGFGGYTLREVSISSSGVPEVRMYARAQAASTLSADAPVQLEPGQSVVEVTVSGSVQAQ